MYATGATQACKPIVSSPLPHTALSGLLRLSGATPHQVRLAPRSPASGLGPGVRGPKPMYPGAWTHQGTWICCLPHYACFASALRLSAWPLLARLSHSSPAVPMQSRAHSLVSQLAAQSSLCRCYALATQDLKPLLARHTAHRIFPPGAPLKRGLTSSSAGYLSKLLQGSQNA